MYAQDLKKYYVSSIQPAGILYFILPQTNFTNPASHTGFSMDVTYLDSGDSATVNFTYSDPANIELRSITFAYLEWGYRAPVKRIYIDTNKNLWVYRYTFAIPFRDLSLFYRTKEPQITLTTDSGAIPLKAEKAQWKKNADISGRIIGMIGKTLRKQSTVPDFPRSFKYRKPVSLARADILVYTKRNEKNR
ncbi:hypothetical protein FACS189430_12230 [Bacteroidia bacterium]|nr:hypothetical protein FACS189430_12230 [Bacteroidia bacterium]